MEASILNTKYVDSDEMKLKGLFEAFGSSFSLEDITSAFYKADRNADFAGEFLYDMQETASTSSSIASKGEETYGVPFKSLSGPISEKSSCINGKFRAAKKKQRPVSGGTVSSILGKGYVRSMPVTNGAYMGTKPMKLHEKEFPTSALWGEETKLDPSKNKNTQKDIEEFLVKMLGDGFQLDRDIIHQVLDKCGYDMQKSTDKLLDFSAEALDGGKKCLDSFTTEIVDVHSNSKESSMSSQGGDRNGVLCKKEGGFAGQEERSDLQKEVLAAIFDAADRTEALSRRAARAAKRPVVLGELVVEPPRDFLLEPKADSVSSKQENEKAEDKEDSYQQLRRAVKEYRATMKEYYKEAVDAFAKGDYDLANLLIDKGHFFHQKARKADEESSQKIFETKNMDTQNEVTLDLHEHGAKEALRLLKCHLSSLSGISSIKYLKVIIETNEEDTSKGARRKWVMKLLEKESIKWTDGQDSGTILIRLDNINPKSLSFTKR